MLAQIIQTRVAADQELSRLQWLDVKIDISARDSLAQNLLYDVCHRNNAFGATELVHHDGQSLGVRQKQFQ